MSIEALITHYGLAALFVGSGIEGEAAALTGGFLAHRHLIPLWGAMVATITGSFLNDQIWFAIGRRFRDHPRVQAIAAKPAFARALGFLERYPTGFIFGFRFIYGLRTVSPVAIGTSQVPQRNFLMLNGIAAIIWGSAFTLLGFVFGQSLDHLLGRARSIFHLALMAILAVLAAAALVHIVRRIYLRYF